MSTDNIEIIVAIVYFFSAFFIAFVADQRGHSFGAAFLASLIMTPITAAILYAPFAPGKPVQNTTASPIPDSSWSPARLKLKEQFEKGEMTVEEYQKQWNDMDKK